MNSMSSALKKLIKDMYEKRNLTVGKIANILGIAQDEVRDTIINPFSIQKSKPSSIPISKTIKKEEIVSLDLDLFGEYLKRYKQKRKSKSP